MTWLIVCRAIQGVGGGAIYQLVQIIIADIVPLQECVFTFALFLLLISPIISLDEANMVDI